MKGFDAQELLNALRRAGDRVRYGALLDHIVKVSGKDEVITAQDVLDRRDKRMIAAASKIAVFQFVAAR